MDIKRYDYEIVYNKYCCEDQLQLEESTLGSLCKYEDVVSLIAEVERLEKDNERLCSNNRTIWYEDYIYQKSEIEKLKKENEKLRDALDAWQQSR